MNKRNFLTTSMAMGASLALGPALASGTPQARKTTFVLVHGAFAGSDGWNQVAARLARMGYHVISAANPLRGVATDASSLGALVDQVAGSILLVGHSYGGMLISSTAAAKPSVKALVYIGAFAPDTGESVVDLASRFPGSTLGDALSPVPLPDGGKDLYIAVDKYHGQFCADLPPAEAALMAANQRPIAEAAILEKAGPPAWKSIPSWHLYGTADRNIPAAAMQWMAQRARSRETVEIKGASHVPHVSHAAEVARLLDRAARAVA